MGDLPVGYPIFRDSVTFVNVAPGRFFPKNGDSSGHSGPIPGLTQAAGAGLSPERYSCTLPFRGDSSDRTLLWTTFGPLLHTFAPLGVPALGRRSGLPGGVPEEVPGVFQEWQGVPRGGRVYPGWAGCT